MKTMMMAGIGLCVLSAAALAEPQKMTEDQMGDVTAGIETDGYVPGVRAVGVHHRDQRADQRRDSGRRGRGGQPVRARRRRRRGDPDHHPDQRRLSTPTSSKLEKEVVPMRTLLLSGVTLGLLTSVASAEPLKLSDQQLGATTAGVLSLGDVNVDVGITTRSRPTSQDRSVSRTR